jgi:ubiquinone/menaquinone biosynthesis C-methylase UbiE
MKDTDVHQDFGNVDRTTDPGEFVRYLDNASALDFFKSYKQASFAALQLEEGCHVLDVGCGTGEDVQALARIVGPKGWVVGVDNSETMVAEARKRAEGSDLCAEYRPGDIYQLDFPDNAFDACRADRVFQHLDDPGRALAEMVRVCKPGGRVLAIDPDYGTLAIDSSNLALTRKIENFICDSHRNPWSGRRLYGLFKEAGLLEIQAVAETSIMTSYALVDPLFRMSTKVQEAQDTGLITKSEAKSWLADLQTRDRESRFFVSMSGFSALGKKP